MQLAETQFLRYIPASEPLDGPVLAGALRQTRPSLTSQRTGSISLAGRTPKARASATSVSKLTLDSPRSIKPT
jgi:hypothetical protein